ncbi:MAG: Gfo/Idh/MocA family protein, partial [Acidobacteriota bacterium]
MYRTINDRKIRIALAGCGRISVNHFNSIDLHQDDMELVAVCDTDRTILANTTARYKVPGYPGFEEMLRESKPDLVALCTPSGVHPEQTIIAATHRVNVMTEKPMATRWKDGVRMVKACDENKVRLFVVKQNRR